MKYLILLLISFNLYAAYPKFNIHSSVRVKSLKNLPNEYRLLFFNCDPNKVELTDVTLDVTSKECEYYYDVTILCSYKYNKKIYVCEKDLEFIEE